MDPTRTWKVSTCLFIYENMKGIYVYLYNDVFIIVCISKDKYM